MAISATPPPSVVNGLKVVDDKPTKLRLCINPMYVNLFMRYIQVRYERLTDLVDMLGPDYYMSTSDDKSGYWQLPLHPNMWQYAGFELDGATYVWLVLPFGWALACYMFSLVKSEVYKPLRQKGVHLAYLLDDRQAQHTCKQHGLYRLTKA